MCLAPQVSDPRGRGAMVVAVIVIVAVFVAVSAPVMVAALVNGSDTVDVIDAVSEDATGGWDGR